MKLAPGVVVAGMGDPAPVVVAGFVEFPKFFERLSAVKVSSRIGRIGCDDRGEFVPGSGQVAGFDIFHGEAVTGEGRRRILREQLLKNFDASRFQVSIIALVACPFFMPVEKLGDELWILPPRLPLNGAHRGVCRAGVEDFEPPEKSQRELCNCGYARGICERFPAEGADAVRFSISSDEGGIVTLVWVLEREHSPESHGTVQYSIEDLSWRGEVGEVMAAQARAFLASYLEKRRSLALAAQRPG